MAKIVSLNQKMKRVQIKSFEINNEMVFNYFHKLPKEERDEKLHKALYIGVLALIEDRFSAFLAKTKNELGTELESLKIIFEMKQEIFYKSAVKGFAAEDEIINILNSFFENQKLKDEAVSTGNFPGKLKKNKTGDIVCNIDGDENLNIVIECKFDKSIKLGDISSKDIFTKKSDTAISQLLEAKVNRDAKAAIIVFDISLVDNSIINFCENVRYIPEIGFISIIDSQKGDYSNLIIAYMFAREIALSEKKVDIDKNILAMLINRIIKDIGEIKEIETLVKKNIDNNRKILKQIEKSMLLMKFTEKYLKTFLEKGTLTKEELFNFYMGEEVKEEFKNIEKTIKELCDK